jgi:hypothetical protein
VAIDPITESNVEELYTDMDEHEILLLPPFSDTNREGVRKKLWRNTVEIMASDDEDSDADEDRFALRQTGVFPAKRHCTQLSEVNETRRDTVIIYRKININILYKK